MVEKVGYTKPVAAARPVKRASSVSAPGFAEALAKAEGVGGVDGVEAAGSVGSISNMGGLLGAQEVDERAEGKRKAVKRGRLTLDALSQLRDSLLVGTLSFSTIRQLENLIASERADNDDPVLAGILDEIEVRAAVELAKLEMAGLMTPVLSNP